MYIWFPYKTLDLPESQYNTTLPKVLTHIISYSFPNVAFQWAHAPLDPLETLVIDMIFIELLFQIRIQIKSFSLCCHVIASINKAEQKIQNINMISILLNGSEFWWSTLSVFTEQKTFVRDT